MASVVYNYAYLKRVLLPEIVAAIQRKTSLDICMEPLMTVFDSCVLHESV